MITIYEAIKTNNIKTKSALVSFLANNGYMNIQDAEADLKDAAQTALYDYDYNSLAIIANTLKAA